MTGTIKRIKRDGGYGFIAGEDGVEYFFHSSSLKNCKFEELEEQCEVEFEEDEGQRGPRAADIFVV